MVTTSGKPERMAEQIATGQLSDLSKAEVDEIQTGAFVPKVSVPHDASLLTIFHETAQRAPRCSELSGRPRDKLPVPIG